MKRTFVAAAIIFAAAAAATAQAEEGFSRVRIGAAAGRPLYSDGASVHLAVAPSVALNKHFALGADLGYSYLPLAARAHGGGNKAYWGLATLTADAFPYSKLSPYLVLGYGLGRYADSRGDAELGRAGALGVGLNLRLNPRAHLFVESRFALMDNIVASDGLHMELPVRVGLRVGF